MVYEREKDLFGRSIVFIRLNKVDRFRVEKNHRLFSQEKLLVFLFESNRPNGRASCLQAIEVVYHTKSNMKGGYPNRI